MSRLSATYKTGGILSDNQRKQHYCTEVFSPQPKTFQNQTLSQQCSLHTSFSLSVVLSMIFCIKLFLFDMMYLTLIVLKIYNKYGLEHLGYMAKITLAKL